MIECELNDYGSSDFIDQMIDMGDDVDIDSFAKSRCRNINLERSVTERTLARHARS